MVVYICDKCDKEFNKKCDYDRHINRKNPCIKNGQKKDNRNIINDILEKILQSNQELIKKVEKLEKKVTEVEKKATIKIDNINMINLVTYEDLTFLTEDDQKKLVMSGFRCVQKFVEMIHCNIDKPENKNIYISNKKDMNKVMVYDGSKWKLCSSTIIDDLYDKGIDYIECRFDELKEKGKLQQTAIKRLERVFNQLSGDERNFQKRKINEDIKLILYNNRP